MEEKQITHIYFVGIKGVGMASLAVIAKQAGYTVRGSDVSDVFITDSLLEKNGILVDTGFETGSLDTFVQNPSETLVIATAAHGGLENPQVAYAKQRGIDAISFGKAIGMFQSGALLKKNVMGISVAGSHGKTTTSAMLATALKQLGEDPSYLIGTSTVPSLGDAGHLGSGKYFILEADEYLSDPLHERIPKFLHQTPHYAIITNIDFDHPDFFADVEAVQQAYREFLANVADGGVVCMNGDDELSKPLFASIKDSVSLITYGQGNENTFVIHNVQTAESGISFSVSTGEDDLGTFSLPVLGLHNALNAGSVIALLYTLNFSADAIRNALSSFTGSKRRMEVVGTSATGNTIIDDYAHHPCEVAATISALKEAYPERELVCIFQPHTFSRTESLIDEFAESFNQADCLALLPIFPSAREGKIDENKQAALYEKILDKNRGQFFPTKQNVIEYLAKNYSAKQAVIVTMGAGDVYSLSTELLNI